MGRREMEILELVDKLSGCRDENRSDYVWLDASGMVKCRGIEVASYDELKDEEEEKIKERLRQLGYLEKSSNRLWKK